MSDNKLFLFSKNTDAFAAQRGYNYQTLKTLETWVQNYLEGKKEEIYCEFEEDIFQKDNLKKELKFRQIKLYASGFSFSSEEIRKSIGHFFTLHSKLDYSEFAKEFVFETNSNITKKYKDNDAELLREWFENQDNLDAEKLSKFAEKTKKIVSEYIDAQSLGIKDKTAAESAIKYFKSLDDNYWMDFTRMIKWRFLSVSADAEFEAVINRSQELVARLPSPPQQNGADHFFSVLLERVFMVVSESDSEDRKLTAEMLEHAMLNMGSAEDQWYARRLEYYRTIDKVDVFRIGEFYEILDLVNYCRRKIYLHIHKDIWKPLITYYARNSTIHDNFRRKAIYELIFLSNEFYEVDYENLGRRDRPGGSLVGLEDDIRLYFGDLSAFEKSDDLENARTIIGVLVGAIGNKKSDIKLDEIKTWFLALYKKVSRKLLTATDNNEKCSLLEQKGMMLIGINRIRNKSGTEFLPYFDSMLALLDNSPLFQLSRFGERIEKYIKMQIHNDPKDSRGVTQALEDFSDRLFPLVEKREGRIQLAKTQVRRGYSYLKTSEPKNMLRALDYFHKAKDNYLIEDTIEGFILALLNIAHIYNALGIHFAAKHYGLAAYRMAGNKDLLNRVENSLAVLLHTDYASGLWFSALNVYSQYMQLRFESNFDKTSPSEEISCTQDVAFLLYIMKRSSVQFSYFIKSYFGYLDYVGEEIIEPLHQKIGVELKDDEVYLKAIENQVTDWPLNDIGKVRSISFYALGSLWRIEFGNSYENQSVCEEYISAIQIILSEIALSGIDFHLIKSKIEITLDVSESYKQPEQLASNQIVKWKVYLCRTDSKEVKTMNYHAAFLMVSLKQILDNISLLPDEEFEELIVVFLKGSRLDAKQLVVNLYQKMHRDVYRKSDFEALKPHLFEKEHFPGLSMPRENKFMVWNDTLSNKYDREFNLEAIRNRFENIKQCTYLTLENLKRDSEFPKFINTLRNQGWKDWQIMSNIQNFMVNYKVQVLEVGEFPTEKAYVDHYQKMFYKYTNMDEKDCYIEFPLEAFQSREFIDQFDISLPSTLRTYGLETKQMTPNFVAIKEFLEKRFNLLIDDTEENNTLIDIAK